MFYNYWFIGDAFADVDAVGARVGLLYVSGRVLLLGVAVDKAISECALDCTIEYPNLTISLAF